MGGGIPSCSSRIRGGRSWTDRRSQRSGRMGKRADPGSKEKNR